MTDDGATTKTDDLKQKLAQHIDTARGKLDALKKDVVAIHEEDLEMLRQKQDELHARLDRQREQARKLQSDIANWKNEKVAHTQEAVASWRQRREIAKLQDRAEHAEDFALRMVNLAAIDFEEAEQAILDAVAARFDAELASSSAPASTR